MITFYLCFLAGGAVLPLLNFILGTLTDGADSELDMDVNPDVSLDTFLDLDADVNIDPGMDLDTDVDIQTGMDMNPSMGAELDGASGLSEVGSAFAIGFLPTSLMSLSTLALIFGAVGAVMTLTDKGRIITFAAAAVSGYIASVAVQTIIKTLKNIQKRNYGINETELLMYDGKVVDTILPGQLGTVSFHTLKHVHVTYPARCTDPTLKLSSGRLIKAVELKDGVFLVEPKNKYE